jgi:hypothetical protein
VATYPDFSSFSNVFQEQQHTFTDFVWQKRNPIFFLLPLFLAQFTYTLKHLFVQAKSSNLLQMQGCVHALLKDEKLQQPS